MHSCPSMKGTRSRRMRRHRRGSGTGALAFAAAVALGAALASAEVTTTGAAAAAADPTTPPDACRVLALLPLSDPSDADGPSSGEDDGGRSLLASALLAVGHFNDRNGAVVPALADAEFARPSPPPNSSGPSGRRSSALSEFADAADAAGTASGTATNAFARVTLDDDPTPWGGCPVHLSLTAHDSYYSGLASDGAGSRVGGIGGGGDVVSALVSEAAMYESTDSPLCAVLGEPSPLSTSSGSGGASMMPSTDDLSAGLSSLSSAMGLARVLYNNDGASSSNNNPTTSGGARTASLDEYSAYRRRTAPVSLDASPSAYGNAAASYLTRAGLDRRYATVLYDGTHGVGAGIKSSVVRAAEAEQVAASEGKRKSPLTVRKVAYFPSPSVDMAEMSFASDSSDGSEDDGDAVADADLDDSTAFSIRRAVHDVSMIGYRTIVLSPPSDPSTYLPDIALEAQRAGLLNGDRLWIVPDASGTMSEFVEYASATKGSALDMLLGGLAIVRTVDGFAAGDDGEAFVEAWLSGAPLGDDGAPLSSATSSPPPPPARASFVYDSVLALGMGLCRQRAADASVGDETGETASVDVSLAEAIRGLSFAGASGMVSFDARTGERSKEGVTFGVYNVRRVVEVDADGVGTGAVRYLQVLTSTKTPAFNGTSSGWSDVADEAFLYASGSLRPPTLLRDDQSVSYIGPAVHYAGLSLMSLSLAISACSALWVFLKRNTRVVSASQPQFLYVLCFGSALSASSIAFMSYDESYGWSNDKLNASCKTASWFFVLGYIVVYSALHMKLDRIHRVLQFRKRARVRNRQVALPFAVLLLSAVTVLTVWTAVDPYTWTRESLSEIPPISCGSCMSENLWAYLVPLAVIMVAATVLTARMAWKARDIPGEFQESVWIWYGVFAHLQSWIIGVPVLVILAPAHASADASYLGRALLVFTFSASMVVLVIWPKVFVVARRRIYGDDLNRSGRGGLKVGTGSVTVSGMGTAASTVARTMAREPNDGGGNLPQEPTASVDSSCGVRSLSTSKTMGSSSHLAESFDLETNVSSDQRKRSVRFSGDVMRQGSGLAAAPDSSANEAKMQHELQQSIESLGRKEVELEEAVHRITVLEENIRGKDTILRCAQERIALLEDKAGGDCDEQLRCLEEGGS